MATYDRVIENLTLTSSMDIIGPEWDNTLIRNITIKNVNGDGMMIRNVDNLRIENVTIDNVSGYGIRLSSTGSTSNVVIEASTIRNTGRDGIIAAQDKERGVDHPGLQILNNTIESTGTSGGTNDSRPGIHGLYIQSTDFLIDGNHILNSIDENAISVRSSGVISNNLIENARGSGIAYYADHHKGSSNALVIEDNTIINTGNGTNRSDINLLGIPSGQNNAAVGNFIIRDNNFSDTDGTPVAVASDYSRLGANVSISNNTQGAKKSDYFADRPSAETPVEQEAPEAANGSSVTVNLSLESSNGSRTLVEQSLDEFVFAPIKVEAQTQLQSVSIPELKMTLQASSANGNATVTVHDGQLGVYHAGENLNQGSQLSSGETLSIRFDDDSAADDAFLFRAQLGSVSRGEGVNVTAYRDGAVVSDVDLQLRSSQLIFDPGVAFDRLELTPDAGDSFYISAFEAERTLYNEIL
ncbi:right-handed parallel beta-helix repeat-containing protein [Sulfitobacter sp. AS59]|uniref:right-handed parallel beta-helix repeat-containing protein n=1 Tax=Sulfitobacter sp. AS59 TaxID=3135784 RepID=UPI00316FAE88